MVVLNEYLEKVNYIFPTTQTNKQKNRREINLTAEFQ